ncbi:hypothetical protein TD95_000964 [Thielaviopsis punctulata]|uniref:Uncharacterized protein n=1 Tax=Thielaviopsis punctulata TaxID=72032 RepID=A0A0F4ZC74_9PEZI|nr:hypothetical protein TD95_000964 [Thielaviopsis punctulata]
MLGLEILQPRDHRVIPDTDLRDHDRDRDRERGRERERDRSTASSSTRDRDRDDDAATTSDASNAETVVLHGKDGYSPSKVRKVKHEREKDDDTASDSQAPAILPPLKLPAKNPSLALSSAATKPSSTSINANAAAAAASASATTATASSEQPRILYGVLSHKKPVRRTEKAQSQRLNGHTSSGPLSSAAPPSTSPPPTKRRSQSSAAATGTTTLQTSDSESEAVSKPAAKEKAAKISAASTDKAGSDKAALPKRKLIKTESDDEGEVSRKVRRPRISDHGLTGASRNSKDTSIKSHKSELSALNSVINTRSISPMPKPLSHRRSASTNGVVNKKRKTPTPIHALEYNSDESSANGSPHPGRHSATIPRGVAERVDSPAGKGPSKKHLDAHGQTLLARACAKGEYEIAKQRLAERPEDLNVADYAGNTPLQIAALHGSEEIVDLLLRAGCNKHCINYDKETPLLDAVDNGHVGVVRLLLNAGVNPRKANCNGEEPLARVDNDSETGPEIRALLEKARAEFRHPTEGPREADETTDTMEDSHHHLADHDHSRNSRAPDSPSSAALFGSVASHRRAGAARATKTSNHLLYMNMDDKTLRAACGRGDYETVTHLLEVRLDFNYPEAMTAAARGGHEVVMELLLALGGADPDPAPIKTGSSDTATPILAAIGQENIKVLKLLLEQSAFDPTRRFKGMTYYELARERKGVNCKEEEELLKKAYDEYRRKYPEKAKIADREHNQWLLEQDRRDKDQSSSAADRDRDTATQSTSTKPTQAKRASSPSPRDPDMLKKKNITKPTASGSASKEQDSKDKEPRESKKLSELKEKKRASSADFSDDPTSKRGSILSNSSATVTKTKKKDKDRDADSVKSAVTASDREMSPVVQKKKTKRTVEADAAASSEGEAVKPRRKLMSKGELTAEHEKQRRASMASTASSSIPPNQPSSPRERDDQVPLRTSKADVPSEKYHNRTKAIKRDEGSVDAALVSKRHRTSTSPPPRRTGLEKEDQEAPNTKRRRVEAEVSKEQRRKKLEKAEAGNASADDGHEPRLPKTGILSRDPPTAKAAKVLKETREREAAATRELSKGTLKDALKAKKLSATSAANTTKHDRSHFRAVLSAADSDVEMKDAPTSDTLRARKDQESKTDAISKRRRFNMDDTTSKSDSPEEKKHLEERVKAQEKRRAEEEAAAEAEEAAEAEAAAAAAKKRAAEEEREAERRRREQEAEEARLAREAKEREEAEAKRADEEARIRRERELEQQRLVEEQRNKAKQEKRIADEVRAKEVEAERKRNEEEEKRERERLRRVEEERRSREEEEELKRKEEESRRKAEEDRQRQVEEDRRHAREESERLQREQLEREAREADEARRRREEERNATKAAEQHRIKLEQEQARIAGLPAVLRWFELCPNPRQTVIAEKFFHMQGVRYDTLDSSLDGTAEGREQWVLNIQAALLLGDKDLTLSRYTDWKRIPATRIAKTMIWRVENDRYALTSPRYFDIGRELPSYYGEPNDPDRMTQQTMERLREDAMTCFFNMDMFFVKLSDLMYIVPTMPHLRDLRLAVEYRELPDCEDLLRAFFWSGQKWRKDPDADKYMGFAPKRRYFVNGEYTKEVLPCLGRISSTPFPENPVPRRFGLTQVHPHESDYIKLCKQQGLHHLIPLATGTALLANENGEAPATAGSSTTASSGVGTSVVSLDSPSTANGHSS